MRISCLALLLSAAPAAAQVPPPERTGPVIEVATTAQLAPILTALTDAYRQSHPGQAIHIAAVGSDVAMAWLYTGRADVAVIGRDAADPEAKAFEWVFRHPPQMTPVMRGSVAQAGRSPALAVRVNAGNPVRSLTIAQLASLFRIGTTPTWQMLGVTGPLAAKPIHLILPDAESGTGRFLRKALLSNATQYDWGRVHEISEPTLSAGHDDRLGRTIAQAVAADPAALGIGDASPLAGTHVVAVEGRLPGAPHYQLDRRVNAYADPHPRDAVTGWLSFLTSDAAQAIIAHGPYRALRAEPASAAVQRLRK
jgi:phosphate transport system substrate-binding protein